MPEYEAKDLVTTVSFKASLTSEQTTDSDGKKVEGPKYNYKAEITYASVKDAVEKASKFTTWTLQRLARNGDLPQNELFTVNGEGEYKKSAEQEIADMSEEEAMRQFELLKARFEAAKKSKKA